MSRIHYTPSEAAIDAAIERRIGSAGFFQRVAEQVARGLYPDMGATLIGRRPDDKTRPGWPDAYLTAPDSSMIIIEATTRDKPVESHWPHDLEKAGDRLTQAQRGGMIWAAWHDPPRPNAPAEMHSEARALGFRGEDIHILFRKDLCILLRSPFHAGFWIRELDIQVTSDPFELMADVIGRSAFRRSESIFPTKEEYEEGAVHEPALLGAVEKALVERRGALVVGRGASGKTTLAKLLALRPRYEAAPSYYLDLSTTGHDAASIASVCETITLVSDRGVLVVIDNAHMSPDAAIRIFHQWEKLEDRFDLLMLTRRVRASAEAWQDDVELEALPIPGFNLVISPVDLEGVYRRLHRARHGSDGAAVPPAILAAWHNIFGGDLLAFSAALLGLLQRGGDLAELNPSDARRYVRDHYLEAETLKPERKSLLDLAAVAEIETAVPVDAFPEKALDACIRQGLVWVEVRGIERKWRSYRLVHPGLGTLLRDAAGLSDSSQSDRCRILKIYPYVCSDAAQRVQGSGDTVEARALMVALWSEAGWPLADLALAYWTTVLRLTRELEVLSIEEVRGRAAAWLAEGGAQPKFGRTAFFAPLGHLARVLPIFRDRLPEVHAAVCRELASPGNRNTLVERAFKTYVGGLAEFLDYAAQNLFDVEMVLRVELSAESREAALIRQVLRSPLGQIPVFLDYAARKLPKLKRTVLHAIDNDKKELLSQIFDTPLHDLTLFIGYADREAPKLARLLCKGLRMQREALLKRAQVSPFCEIVTFLNFARHRLPDVGRKLKEDLQRDESVNALTSRIRTTPASELATFLAFAGSEMPIVERALREALETPQLISDVAAQAVFDGPGELMGLWREKDLLLKVVAAIDAESWSRQWSKKHHDQPSWIKRFSFFCYRANRLDLLATTAAAVIRTAHRSDFPLPGSTILQLSYLLTSPHDCTPGEVDAFIARCFPEDWVASQYLCRDATAGALAGALRWVGLDDRTWLRSRFRHPNLVVRLRNEQPRSGDSAQLVAEWMQLLSAAQLLELETSGLRLDEAFDLRAVGRIFPPGPETEGIQPMQAGVWGGFREWCRLSGREACVDRDVGDGILAQFRCAQLGGRVRPTAFNEALVIWLDRSRDQGWRLVADSVPLARLIESREQGTGLETA